MDNATPYLHIEPRIDPSCFVAPSANVVGDVTIGPRSSIWYQAVLRADIQSIRIGEESNIQDGCVVHLSRSCGVEVGDRVTCGHRAILHACRIADEVLVGMGAIVMDGAVVGTQSIVGAGALITQRQEIPPGSLVFGSPARVMRPLKTSERESIADYATRYVKVSETFMKRDNS